MTHKRKADHQADSVGEAPQLDRVISPQFRSLCWNQIYANKSDHTVLEDRQILCLKSRLP